MIVLRPLHAVIFWAAFALFCPDCTGAQGVENPEGDLWGDNLGDQIQLFWSYDSRANTYVVYRSMSENGPWSELFRTDNVLRGTFVDITPNAGLRSLCYKVEAYDQRARLVRFYQPMCVPRYKP